MAGYQIYGLGNALVDTEIEVDDAFLQAQNIDKGMMTLVDQARQSELRSALGEQHWPQKRACGGSGANSVIAAQYFGAQCFYSCKVADDESGDFYANDLRASGVESNLDAHRQAGTTGECLVMVTPDAERSMLTFLGVSSSLCAEDLAADALAQSACLYLEGYLVTSDDTRNAALVASELARSQGIKRALTFSDPSMVQFFKPQLLELIGDGVDLLFCNEQEACLFTQTEDVEQAAQALKSIASSFAITLGARGAMAFDGEQMHEIAAYPAEAVDSNGAGDMFAGAFLYGISQDLSFAEAGQLASLASSEVVKRFGPRLPAQMHADIKAELGL